MRFTKMHGLGNDYVYVEGFTQNLPDPHELARQVADRHFGVGGDGMILALPPTDDAPRDDQGNLPAARMRMFNVDGTEGEMCGNGVRCVCKLVHDHQLGEHHRTNPMRIQTGHGVLSLAYELDAEGKVCTVAVDMGQPILELPQVPVDESKLDARLDGAVFVSMGNPHAVLFFDRDRPLEDPAFGAELEHHPAFTNRMNVHFAHVINELEAAVYHWERGSGATLACGTGACAVCVAGVIAGRTGRKLTAHLPGGDLQLEWRESDNHLVMRSLLSDNNQREMKS